MALFSLLMPKMGESVTEATILAWQKKPGDTVAEHDIILEVATDKVDSDVPSPVAGVIKELRFQVGDVVPVGEVLATIETDSPLDEAVETAQEEPTSEAAVVAEDTPAEQSPAEIPEPTDADSPAPDTDVPYVPSPPPPPAAPSKTAGRYYSPLVLNIAQTEGIPLSELEQVSGTGLDGRITKDDILQYISNRQPTATTTPPPLSTAKETETPLTTPPQMWRSGEDEIIEMDRMRKLIAKNMVASRQTSAHVSSFVEADLTHVVQWRNRHKEAFRKREGFNLTFMPVFVEAVVKAIKDFPMINISVDGEKIIRKQGINIGIATALPTGNLIVPVVKNADRYSLGGLAAAINDLVQKARNNNLSLENIEGGTYTITNIGTFGNILGTPIILQPQVAIMAVGAITKKPVVLETKEGDVIAIRHMMYLSHTYDHRVVDGMLGGQFVRRVADYLEQFDTGREI